jgi:hypothetical protein
MTAQPDAHVAVEPVFLSKPATCVALGEISERVLEGLMRTGQIVPRTIGGRVVFPIAEVRRFADACPSWEPRRRA